jgi:hypothetical protein
MSSKNGLSQIFNRPIPVRLVNGMLSVYDILKFHDPGIQYESPAIPDNATLFRSPFMLSCANTLY